MLHHRYERCVGSSLDDAWLLARRFETEPSPWGEQPILSRSEWWIGRVTAGKIVALWATRTPLEGLVPADEGVLTIAARDYVTGRLGELSGLWHVKDGEPFAIEARSEGEWDGVNALTSGGHAAWTRTAVRADSLIVLGGDAPVALPFPPVGHLAHVAGVDASSLLAAGSAGELVRWDGRSWQRVEGFSAAAVYALLVESAQTAHVGAARPNVLYRVDGSTATALARSERAVVALAVHRGVLCAALDERGLHAVDGDRLRELPFAIMPIHLHAGADALILTDESALADTVDLQTERSLGIEEFAALVADRTPLWKTGAIDSEPGAFSVPPARRGIEELLPVRHHFSAIEGTSLDDAFVLGSRSDEEHYEADESDHFVGRVVNGVVQSIATSRVVLGALSRVPSGRVYAAAWSEKGGVWRTPSDGSLSWERLAVPRMQGLFALSDECVIAWGGVGNDQAFHLFDGSAFRSIPSPPERVLGVHGCAPDWIVAVGHQGSIARWDGRSWRPWTLPTRGTFGNVHVVSPDEMYATGPLGAVYEGSSYGWIERAPVEGLAVGIVAWRGDVYVGDPLTGLLRLHRDRLDRVDLDVWPSMLRASETGLLMVDRDGYAETRDLKTVRRLGRPEMEVALREHPPRWRAARK